jgi:hypothetical protein
MANKKTLTTEEVKSAVDQLDLEGKIEVYEYAQHLIESHQKDIADQMALIESSKKKLNGQ